MGSTARKPWSGKLKSSPCLGPARRSCFLDPTAAGRPNDAVLNGLRRCAQGGRPPGLGRTTRREYFRDTLQPALQNSRIDVRAGAGPRNAPFYLKKLVLTAHHRFPPRIRGGDRKSVV